VEVDGVFCVAGITAVVSIYGFLKVSIPMLDRATKNILI
jgi:hypothetical protein